MGDREDAFVDERLASGPIVRVVHSEHLNCHPSGCGCPEDAGSSPLKMVAPNLAPRVKEWGYLSRQGIESGNIGTFVLVAVQTGKRKIAGYGSSAVALRQDMVDLEWNPVAFLRHQAVFAASACAPPDFCFQWRHEDEAGDVRSSDLRALDCISASVWPT